MSPVIASRISVTSSGRSSISMIMICSSGLFLRMDLDISFSRVVFPALGGDTIMPLWPLPIGAIRSTILMETSLADRSMRSRSLGKIGVMFSNVYLPAISPGANPFTDFTNSNAENFSCWARILVLPDMISPVLSPKRRIWEGDT